MVPKQSFETRRPVLPSVVYFMAFSFLVTPKFSWLDGPNPDVPGIFEATPTTKAGCDDINAPPLFP
jgi:hypothetical protein